MKKPKARTAPKKPAPKRRPAAKKAAAPMNHADEIAALVRQVFGVPPGYPVHFVTREMDQPRGLGEARLKEEGAMVAVDEAPRIAINAGKGAGKLGDGVQTEAQGQRVHRIIDQHLHNMGQTVNSLENMATRLGGQWEDKHGEPAADRPVPDNFFGALEEKLSWLGELDRRFYAAEKRLTSLVG